MTCEDTLERYITDVYYRMGLAYYAATGKLFSENKDTDMDMYKLRSNVDEYFEYSKQLQLFLEMKNRIKLSSETRH